MLEHLDLCLKSLLWAFSVKIPNVNAPVMCPGFFSSNWAYLRSDNNRFIDRDCPLSKEVQNAKRHEPNVNDTSYVNGVPPRPTCIRSRWHSGKVLGLWRANPSTHVVRTLNAVVVSTKCPRSKRTQTKKKLNTQWKLSYRTVCQITPQKRVISSTSVVLLGARRPVPPGVT